MYMHMYIYSIVSCVCVCVCVYSTHRYAARAASEHARKGHAGAARVYLSTCLVQGIYWGLVPHEGAARVSLNARRMCAGRTMTKDFIADPRVQGGQHVVGGQLLDWRRCLAIFLW
jgi:hypothetical protein